MPPNVTNQIQIIKEGFKPVTQKVKVKSGVVDNFDIVLESEKARLTFKLFRENAQLFIDERYVGGATQSILLQTRQHLITIQAPGYMQLMKQLSPQELASKK